MLLLYKIIIFSTMRMFYKHRQFLNFFRRTTTSSSTTEPIPSENRIPSKFYNYARLHDIKHSYYTFKTLSKT
jgi:hypothetical protein